MVTGLIEAGNETYKICKMHLGKDKFILWLRFKAMKDLHPSYTEMQIMGG